MLSRQCKSMWGKKGFLKFYHNLFNNRKKKGQFKVLMGSVSPVGLMLAE